MTIDVFQYSNIYTLRKSIQWLADESVVKEQCGPYVTIPGIVVSARLAALLISLQGQQVPDWAQLLHWYSRLKLGKTVLEWMEENHVSDAIDVRRLTSFGVIKVSALPRDPDVEIQYQATTGFSAPSAQMACVATH